jgi:hypothetical protein
MMSDDDVELLEEEVGFLGISKELRMDTKMINNRGKKYFGLQLSILLIALGAVALDVLTFWQMLGLILISIPLALYFSIQKFEAVKG